MSPILTCSSCQRSIPEEAHFCPFCGEPSPKMQQTVCPNCGAFYTSPAPTFCNSCGFSFSESKTNPELINQTPAPFFETSFLAPHLIENPPNGSEHVVVRRHTWVKSNPNIYFAAAIALGVLIALFAVFIVLANQGTAHSYTSTADAISTSALQTVRAAGMQTAVINNTATEIPVITAVPVPILSLQNVSVSVFVTERVFMRVSVDGVVAFEGRVEPRETKMFEAANQVEVLTGNGAAVQITYNGRDLGFMGNVGEVVSRIYSPSGVFTPNSTISP